MRFRHALRICGFIYVISLSLFGEAIGSYFSGASPTPYCKGSELSVKVSDMTSRRTQIPLSYYSIPHCQPEKILETTDLSEVLGFYSENSLYKFKMLESEHCHVVCRVKLDTKSAKEFKEKIDDDYRVNMILDDLPLILRHPHDENSSSIYERGFNVGFTGQYVGEHENTHFIYNHLSFIVKYNRDIHLNCTNIVGFEVKAFSVHHYESTWDGKTGLITCELNENVLHLSGPQEVKENEEIIFTYNVKFQESDLKWASRWETHPVVNGEWVHWFPILRSLVFIIILSVRLGKLIFETLGQESSRLIKFESVDQVQKTRWRNDVLSPPSKPHLFCLCIGTGVQIFGVVLGTSISALFGYLSSSDQTCLVTIMLWVFMGLFAGYTSSWLHKVFQGRSHWTKIPLITAVAFPTAVFIISSALNILLGRQISSMTVPFQTVASVFTFGSLFWIPPALVGGYIGSRKTALENQATSEPPRQPPDQPWTKSRLPVTLLLGILPYAAVETEIFYILKSICMHQFYSSYNFLLSSFILLVVTCTLSTVRQCHNQLSNDNYHSWWQPFLVAGSSALHYLIISVYIVLVEFRIRKPVSLTLFLGYILIAAPSFFLMTGTIGFFACFWFTRFLPSAIKTD